MKTSIPRRRESYREQLAKLMKEIGCAPAGAPYVIGGLIIQFDSRLGTDSPQAAHVATAFLDEAKCAGAHGLSEENKAKLRRIRDRAPLTAASPEAARR